ncbi:hypothetical protein BMS3Bbin05_00837 [bacterium BMS3Bbin05]|nr:hypothetical protein BMS3Bbin05_00837 [bacterium BMS3Bbin05]HDL20568.1 hypothetical protein [Nitrospirota bacterium]HDO23067.1 hypothetical protein [Nitrospirota bacterium]
MNLPEKDYTKYYQVLEINTDASLSDVKRAYTHLKDLYSTDSIVTFPLSDEFPEYDRVEVLRQIEEAYLMLRKLLEGRSIARDIEDEEMLISYSDDNDCSADVETFSGQVLRQIREKKGIALNDISLTTKIRFQYLVDIELEKFDSLPPEVYTRGFVMDYARCLSIDPKRAADDFMIRLRAWKKISGEKH